MMHTVLMTEKLPKYILDYFNNDIYELLQHTKILDSSITEGLVYKISIEGNLEKDGYESSFLYLTKGSCIKEHTHTDEKERYILVSGKLNINGEFMLENECEIGQSHCIDRVPTDTLICTYKEKNKIKKLLPSTNLTSTNMK